MRLGRDTIVLTKNDSGMHVGMLSQSFLEKIGAEHVIVPIISFNKQRQLVKTADSEANLTAILENSLLTSEKELLVELDAIIGKKGTRIIIWHLRTDTRGCTEFDFEKEKYDIRIPDEPDETGKRGYKKQERVDQDAPDSDYSLRAYCSILYLKPRMQIIIRGQKVQTQLVSKSLAYIEKDVYRPKCLGSKTVKITFGYNCKNKDHYGMMMYHKNRLIKAYERVGCQQKANNMGLGVVGVIECNFLKPTHNKQNFDYTNDYRRTMTVLGQKLNDYFNEMKVKKNTDPQNLPVEDLKKNPDQNWVQCDSCLKWRKLPDGMGKLPTKWYCNMNADPQFRDCSVPEEPEDDDEITHSTYEKTYKKRKAEQHQPFEKPTILFTPPSKELQAMLRPPESFLKSYNIPNGSGTNFGKNSYDRSKRRLSNEQTHVAFKKPKFSESESIEVTDFNFGEEEDVIILEESSTPRNPRTEYDLENVKSERDSPLPMEISFDANEAADRATSGATAAVGTQTERRCLTVKKEEDTTNDSDWQENRLEASTYSNGIGGEARSQSNNLQSPARTTEQDKEHSKKNGDRPSGMLKRLNEAVTDMRHKDVKKEASHQMTQTDANPSNINGDSQKQLVGQYEQALKEINKLRVQCKTLEKLKSESGTCTTQKDDDNSSSEVDEIAVQLDGVFRQLDACCTERDQYKSEIEQLKEEKIQLRFKHEQLETEVGQLKLMVEEMTRKEGASTYSMMADASTSEDESLKLRTLRVNVAQLLTTLMPDLDLQQIDYDVDVIDEILGQVLEQARETSQGT
ncbi:MORC family CW-type zinc finger protein 3 isoform X3 [Ascaphus truei]